MMMDRRPQALMAGAALAAAFAVSGCATEKYVDAHVAAVGQKIDALQAQTQAQADASQRKIADHDAMLARLDKATREAFERAEAAGKLAEGKFLYTVTLQDDGYTFQSSKSALSDEEKSRLTDLASKLKADNKNVYLEIQGYTDSTGSADANLRLGQARAEAVRLFLNQQGVALNRMDAISYGDAQPVASNKTKAGRAQNRRVRIVVLA
jgi:peptidoglycan-associated lipoprotein